MLWLPEVSPADSNCKRPTDPLVQLTGAGKRYRNKSVLEDINLAIYPGKITTLIGPNGAGKTTLIKAILGLETPDSGRIERKRGLRIGYMPQKLHIDPTLPLTTLRFLQLACRTEQTCLKGLARAGIPHLAHSPVQTLSGGEMQRALLARALLREPELLILDEPVQGVDIIGQESFYQLICELRDELGCAIVMVSHDLHLVMSATDNVVCLNQHICCHGNPEQVSNNPAFLQLFGDKTAIYTHDHDHNHNLHGDVVGDHNGQSRVDDCQHSDHHG